MKFYFLGVPIKGKINVRKWNIIIYLIGKEHLNGQAWESNGYGNAYFEQVDLKVASIYSTKAFQFTLVYMNSHLGCWIRTVGRKSVGLFWGICSVFLIVESMCCSTKESMVFIISSSYMLNGLQIITKAYNFRRLF